MTDEPKKNHDLAGMLEYFEATREHVARVQHFMVEFAEGLIARALIHDESKYDPEEANDFARVLPELRGLTYGSDEYKAKLGEIKPAIDRHYQHNSHHPEHHENGIEGMDLLDFVEMFCDWRAATERHENGDMNNSIAINAHRWKMCRQTISLLQNTVPWIESVA